MAHSFDVIAYVAEGEIYCEDCIEDPESDEVGAWFGDDESGLIGHSCGGCHMWYAPDGDGWTDADPKNYRWARCESCNGQYPFSRNDRDARRDALRGKLDCHGCSGELHF